jgi:hypothetical protein
MAERCEHSDTSSVVCLRWMVEPTETSGIENDDSEME